MVRRGQLELFSLRFKNQQLSIFTIFSYKKTILQDNQLEILNLAVILSLFYFFRAFHSPTRYLHLDFPFRELSSFSQQSI